VTTPPAGDSLTRLPDPEDEQEAFRELAGLFEIIDRWQAERDAELPVQPGSALARDDQETDPFQLSHAAIYALGVAVDHLHCLRMTIQTAQSLHTFAPFTLNRAAMEAAATAVWLIAPRARDERIRRRLVLAVQNARDVDNVGKLIGKPSALDYRYKRILEIGARRPGLDPNGLLGTPPGMERIVREAGAGCAVGAELALISWKSCSGITHSRIWAGVNFLDREELTRVGNVSGVRVTASAGNVAMMTAVSAIFVGEARRLFDLRASNARA